MFTLVLRPNFTPFALAYNRLSFVSSSICSRFAWATADSMVTTIFLIVPSVLIPPSRNRITSPFSLNSLIS